MQCGTEPRIIVIYQYNNMILFDVVALWDVTVNLFKTRLDRFWANQDVKYDFTADLTGTGDRSVYEVYDT